MAAARHTATEAKNWMLNFMRPRDDRGRVTNNETLLWQRDGQDAARCCVIVSCCSGAELQIRRGAEVLLRELHPDESTLYRRARQLRADGLAGPQDPTPT